VPVFPDYLREARAFLYPRFLIMRITLNFDDDIALLVEQYAKLHSLTLEEAISRLVARGVRAHHPTRLVNGIPVVDLPSDSPQITNQHIRHLKNG
jgi:hypothetical protein